MKLSQLAHYANLFMALLWFTGIGHTQEKRLNQLTVSFGSVSATRAPLWIAADSGIFKKYGLDVKLVYIPSGTTSISALLAGDVDIIATAASSVLAAAARGLPIVVVATDGPVLYKLVAHPGITSINHLRGKTIGVSRLGTGPDLLLRRALAKWNLVPNRDVTIIPTGLTDSGQRMLVMLKGKIDATVASPSHVFEMKLQGQHVSVLADFFSLGLFTTASDIATTRQLLESHSAVVKVFLSAFCEGIWLAKTNKELSYQAFRKYLKVEDLRVLEFLHGNYLGATRPAIPYPLSEAIQSDIEFLRPNISELDGKKAADFIDISLLKELESEGFFTKLKR